MTRTNLRPELEDIIPSRMRSRPITPKGYPVPWFASKPDGVNYDLRVIESERVIQAVQQHRCWICGEQLGVHLSFVIGPMCAITRTSGEPPQHRECAIFAAQACPFLALPQAKRREHNYPEGWQEPDGFHLPENPGACAVWCTRGVHVFHGPKGGILFKLGEPHQIWWFANGRPATREEVLVAMNKRLPILRATAAEEGGEQPEKLDEAIATAMTYLPVGPGPVNVGEGA